MSKMLQAKKGHKRTALLRRRVRYGRLDLAGYLIGSISHLIESLSFFYFFSPLSAKGVDIAKKDNANQCWRVSEMMFYSRKVLLKVPSESQLVLR